MDSTIQKFALGDKILPFLPIQGNLLRSKYTGPCVINRKLSNHIISTPDWRKSVNINLIKPTLRGNCRRTQRTVNQMSCFTMFVTYSNHCSNEDPEMEVAKVRSPEMNTFIFIIHKI